MEEVFYEKLLKYRYEVAILSCTRYGFLFINLNQSNQSINRNLYYIIIIFRAKINVVENLLEPLELK